MTAFFNTGLTQQQFLEEYWQKKPLLIRQAFTDLRSPITTDELIELACEPDIESRLIQQNEQSGDWLLKSENLSEQDFEKLAATHWTVLVQDIDKHLAELQSVIDPFRFLPDWRYDDLMASYAPKSGSVGAHTDSYDVFLLQTMGTRRWQISDRPIMQPELISGLDLKILKTFDPDQSWDLAPGDMLYLPPGTGYPVRIHGAFVSDEEVHKVVKFLKEKGAPRYVDEILNPTDSSMMQSDGEGLSGEKDPLYDEAVEIVLRTRKASISYVQRNLRIGYNRAARIIEDMEKAGLVTPMQSNGNREIVAPNND